MKVSVCAATCNRPKGLKRLMDGLNRLEFKKTAPEEIAVVIVDNDRAGLGIELCKNMRPRFRWPLEFQSEPRPGVSYARNRAVLLAKDRSDFIAFIDDDETPEPYWLDELLHVRRLYAADVVTGPVLPYFGNEAPSWVVKGRFFERRRYNTGQDVGIARTGNVLIASKLFNDSGLFFGERYALTGGEDTHFFLRAKRAGYSIIWADKAVVHEWVSGDRTTAGWLLRRAYKGGKAYTMCALELDRSLASILRRAGIGGFRMLQGILSLPLFLVFGRHFHVKTLQRVCMGAGSIISVFSECLSRRPEVL